MNPPEASPKKTFFRIYATLLMGNKKLNKLISNADLGVTGGGFNKLISIDYAPGEVVTEARAKQVLDKVKDEVNNNDKVDFDILSYKIEFIQEITE